MEEETLCTTFTCSAANYDDLVLGLGEIWTAAPVNPKSDYPGATWQKIFNNHGMRVVNEVVVGGKCVGWKAIWLKNCDDSEATKSEESLFDGCDFPEGDDPDCEEAEYDINCRVGKAVSYSDQHCSSRFKGIDQASMQLNKAIECVRKALAKSTVDLVMANMSPNTWEGTNGCPVGGWTEFTNDQFNISLLHHIQNIARKHCCEDYCIVDDCNFYELYLSMMDGKCCSDESGRTTLSRFDLTFDKWLNECTGRNSTLLITPSVFGAVNTTRYTNISPEVKKPGEGDQPAILGWRIADPVFTIRETSSTGATTTRPIYYDVEYKKKCCGRDKNDNFIFRHYYYVTFTGGMWVAPMSCGNGPCNFEFVNIG